MAKTFLFSDDFLLKNDEKAQHTVTYVSILRSFFGKKGLKIERLHEGA